jgi:D-alanine-D-alanine ligase
VDAGKIFRAARLDDLGADHPRENRAPADLFPLRVAVLAGGDSPERAISLKSGAAVTYALQQLGHIVLPIDPAIVDLVGVDWRQFDIAFLALHGEFGEDGQVQHILDRERVLYTGSSAMASEVAFSKWQSKQRFIDAGVATASAVLLYRRDMAGSQRAKVETLGYPVVVKPDAQGSSLGVTLVESADKLAQALAAAFSLGEYALVEQALLGDEWTVGLIDSIALPPIRLGYAQPVFDYHAKYEADSTTYQVDEQAPQAEAVIELARQASMALGTSGLARVDIRCSAAGRPFVLEVNTIPGLTDHSLVPKAAAALGISLGHLCELTILSALSGEPFTSPDRQFLPKPHISLAGTVAGVSVNSTNELGPAK